ncbi:hypothetical protein Bbelb_235270 [Branchiostoma belcheri]|nr:hypothetical protein Bbelb_235270 [Branchiostoma belcheri]
MRQKAAQVYGLIGGGYCAWIAALRIKGRHGEITAKVREGERELSSVKESLQKYLVYGLGAPKIKYRRDLPVGPLLGEVVENGRGVAVSTRSAMRRNLVSQSLTKASGY